MFCSGIVLSLCQIVRIHTGSTFQANIKVGMQFFSETCWSYFRHSTSVWLTETPYHSTWKDASTIDHRYIHTGIIQRVCMTCFFGCIDLFVAQRCSSPFPAIVEVGMSFAGSKIDIYIYIYVHFLKRWGDEVEDIGRCETPVIYPLIKESVHIRIDRGGFFFSEIIQLDSMHSTAVAGLSTQSKWCLMLKSLPWQKGFLHMLSLLTICVKHNDNSP